MFEFAIRKQLPCAHLTRPIQRTMADMLEVEGQLEAAAADDTRSIAPTESEAGFTETASTHGGESFYSSKKSSTWKKFKKLVKVHSKADEGVSC